MFAWYQSLDLLQRVFALIAIPSTAILLIQTVLLFFGIGDGEADGDGAEIDVPDGDDGLMLFSLRSIIAMLCVGGWSGIVLEETSLPPVAVIILSVVIGLAALVGMSLLIRLILRLQSSGNIQLSNAIGKTGQVYLTIPAAGQGNGKVNLTIQDTFTEVNAITRENTAIKTGEVVRIVATDETGMLVVERIAPKNADAPAAPSNDHS